MEDTNASAIEREVQRRVTDHLAAAGVGQGQLSLSVLYMLPPDFIRSYTHLFEGALLESVRSGGVDETGRSGTKSAKRGKRPFAAGAVTTGKKFRTYWVIRDERLFKLKGSVDRKLKRLSSSIDRDLRGKGSVLPSVNCPSCQLDITAVAEVIGPVKYCPRCGFSPE